MRGCECECEFEEHTMVSTLATDVHGTDCSKEACL